MPSIAQQLDKTLEIRLRERIDALSDEVELWRIRYERVARANTNKAMTIERRDKRIERLKDQLSKAKEDLRIERGARRA